MKNTCCIPHCGSTRTHLSLSELDHRYRWYCEDCLVHSAEPMIHVLRICGDPIDRKLVDRYYGHLSLLSNNKYLPIHQFVGLKGVASDKRFKWAV